jgi:fatty acid desaturase
VAAVSFEALRAEVERAGCFRVRPAVAVVSLVVHLAVSALLFWASARWQSVALFVAGSFLFYRLGWLMHDAAHGGTFGTPDGNRRFAALTAGILGEFPTGWSYGHGRHHAAPNVRGRDLDQSERWDPTRRYRTWPGAFVGLLLFSTFRGHTLPKTLLLLGLRDGFFCYQVARERFPRELAGALTGLTVQLGFFCALFGALGPLVFFAHTVVGMLYLNTVFAGNHYDLEHFDEASAATLSFAELQLRTSRNYPPGPLAAFVFGGLEYQIEHHLFPSMPRAGLAKAAPFVRAYCDAHGLPYHQQSFVQSIIGVLRFHLVRPTA